MKKKSYKKENHTHTDMHNGKKRRNNNKNNYYYTIETTKLLNNNKLRESKHLSQQKPRKPHCERSIVASGSRLPSNRVQQSVLFRFESSYNPKS